MFGGLENPAEGAALTFGIVEDQRERDLHSRSQTVPLLVLAVGRDAEGRRLGRCSTMFGSAGECPGTGRQGWGWWLLGRNYLHVFSFVPWDSCSWRVCMHRPATGSSVCPGHLLIFR